MMKQYRPPVALVSSLGKKKNEFLWIMAVVGEREKSERREMKKKKNEDSMK